MPLSKKANKERMRLQRQGAVQPSVQPKVIPDVIPIVQPKHHCSLPFCVICDPEKFRVWFKKTFGKEYKPK